ncbi:MAG: sulfotransferase family protein [Myxococcota bacterium]|nr:sulfotransferase family protein [Myxococcota bacterium]
MPLPITVVSGSPRSGTSMMMSVLEAAGLPLLCDGKRPSDASNPRGYFELEAVKGTRKDPRWLERAEGHAVKVVHALLDALPEQYAYRVLLMRRPLKSVVASQNRMLERLGRPTGEADAERLSQILSAQLDEARQLLDERACFEWIEVDYPGLIADPLSRLRPLGAFLDLPLDSPSIIECIRPELNHATSPPAPRGATGVGDI